jgi:hypothetical protein
MTDIDVPAERDMSDIEEQIAAEAKVAIDHASEFSERGLQAREFKVGVSDLGFCSERTRRMIGQEPKVMREDYLPAFVGTAIGDHVERAVPWIWDDAVIQTEVSVTLTGESGRVYTITGHPDIVRTRVGMVIDTKTARGTHLARRKGPDQQQQFQRHLYALGAHEAGLFGDLPLDQILVGNLWIDRACDEREPYCQLEPFDPDVVEAATQWLDDVVYAFVNQEPARKEPPREMCAKVCGYFPVCRQPETDVEGLLGEDSSIAVQMHLEGTALEKTGRQLKDQAKALLNGVTGSTGRHSVRWVHVNGSHVEFDRDSYDRLDVKEMK